MQHLVVFEMVQQYDGRSFGLARHEDRYSRNTNRFPRLDIGDEHVDREHAALEEILHDFAAAAPRSHESEDQKRKDERHPSAFRNLEQVGAEKSAVDDEER